MAAEERLAEAERLSGDAPERTRWLTRREAQDASRAAAVAGQMEGERLAALQEVRTRAAGG